MTRTIHDVPRVETGVRNLDELFNGGLPKGAVVVLAGPPGAGKTTLALQLCFHAATAERPALYFNTLSEPTAKTLRYLNQYTFFDPGKLDEGAVRFVDVGIILRSRGLEEAAKLLMDEVRKVKPAIIIIDSFKVFDDLARSPEERRKFDYELAVNLMAWEATTLLLGEYWPHELTVNPLFSIVDGLVVVSQREESGEHQRFIQVVKLRGTEHNRDEHAFIIDANGVQIFAPRITIQREERGPQPERCKTGVSRLDDLLGDGIPRGSSLLIAGVAGTGKTLLLLEFLYRGAQAGEKGIIFSFEETEERLRATARGVGWNLDREVDRGMLQIVFIAQPNIMVERHLLMMQERVAAMGARRVGVDSVSVFLHKVKDAQIDREKVFHLASIIQNAQAVGFFATDIPYGQNQISRFGVEETVVDGIILLSATEEQLDRQRYLEVYKLRNTAHLKGRHNMVIGPGGITVYPRYSAEGDIHMPPPALEHSRRLPTGVPGLDELCGGGLIERSVTLISGSAGIGKGTIGLQFILEGARRKEPGLYIALEEGPAQVLKTAEELGLSLEEATRDGLVELMYLSRSHVRASQFLAILDEKIRTQKTRRLVLDSVGYMVAEGGAPDDVRQLLYAMVVRFRSLGVTSIFTLESTSLYSTDTITEQGYSPVADNLFLMRYQRTQGIFWPTLSVLKTRGSVHDFGTHHVTIGRGGIQVKGRLGAEGELDSDSIRRSGRRSSTGIKKGR